MGRYIFVAAIAVVFGCSSSEKIAPVVLPEEGASTDYVDFLPKLRTLAWRATEAFYRDRWDELDDAAQSLERAVKVLKQSKNVPPRVQGELATRCEKLTAECGQLREACRTRAVNGASEHLQQIHILIRELRSEN